MESANQLASSIAIKSNLKYDKLSYILGVDYL